MATQAQATSLPTEAIPAIYAEVDKYPWDTDEEFQGGLAAILGSSPSPAQTAELTLRARCFYYSRYVSAPHPRRVCPDKQIYNHSNTTQTENSTQTSTSQLTKTTANPKV
jgi:hypothetical protein